jgi:hypothetical protein
VNLAYGEWKAAIDPKVTRTRNLHNVFKKSSLDLFVLFGSLYKLCGNPGQADCAAANTFLDLFVEYRRQQGLPASVFDIGITRDIGFLNGDQKLSDRMKGAGVTILQEKDLMDGLNCSPGSMQHLSFWRAQPRL